MALDDAAATGDDDAFFLRKPLAGPDFGFAETVFADGKELGNRLPFQFDNDVVGIEKGRFRRLARALPKVVLPLPGMPMMMMFSLLFIILFHLLCDVLKDGRRNGSVHPNFF